MKISTILDQIDLGSIALPEFQRGYVWNRDQVRDLMVSLYRRYPVGGLLVWVTKTENPDVTARGGGQLAAGTVKLLLDGQQRITSLYGIVRGTPPRFFQGNAQAFTGLYFNLDTETFKFYAPLEMRNSAIWISVTELMRDGLNAFIPRLPPEKLSDYITLLNRIALIKDIELHIEEVTGEDKTVDVVVEIFNKVNSGGTTLTKGELALAKACAEWPEAREQLRQRLDAWKRVGFQFDLEWLLRNITTILTGQAFFSGLDKVDAPTLRSGLLQAEAGCNYLLNTISGRLGLDHDRVLGGRYAFPVMTRYLALRGGKLQDARERDKLLYWYIHASLRGRFSGSTESVLNQDLRVIDGSLDSLDRLIEQLRNWRGTLDIGPEDFNGWSVGARFYPMLYLMTRVGGARDWGSGLPLSANLLGRLNSLQIHHIFPKALLYKHGYVRSEVNALANYCFLTQEANLAISDTPPEKYFPEVERRHPGALTSQWIPPDENLWKVENYREFLAARRNLLAASATAFLDNLLAGPPVQAPLSATADTPVARPVAGGVAGTEEEAVLQECNTWIIQQGLPAGEYLYELSDPETGTSLAILDLAWPRGLQEGLSQPVALLLDEEPRISEVASHAGYIFFTDIQSFRRYVEHEILALSAGVV